MATVGEIVRVAIHYTGNNAGDVMNVFHFVLSAGTGTDVDLLDDLAVWVADEWGGRWELMASQGYTLESFEADIINPDGTVDRNIGGDVIDIPGTVSGDALPAQNAYWMMAYTAVPKARGSKYVPGTTETEVANGALTAGVLADLALLLAIYLTPYTGSFTLTPGVLSRVLEAFVPFIASGLIETLTATQRRRKVGVGI